MSERFTIGNAACSVAKTIEDVKALAGTNIDIITVGSITEQPRTGNPEPRWYAGDGFALNSFGMPNGGKKFYAECLPVMVRMAHDAGKQLSLSVAGFSTEEYAVLAHLADEANVDSLELNFGCPNVSIDGRAKPIVSFDQASIKEIVTAVRDVTKLPILLKLSPYSNPAELQATARCIAELKGVKGVVTSNTFANGYIAEQGNDVLASIYGGVSGKALSAIALGQVRQFRQALPPEIAVIGVGGIETVEDTLHYRHVGASGVQAATLIVREGHDAINRIVHDKIYAR